MAGTGADGQAGRLLGVLLLCFGKLKAAAAARRPLDEDLRSRGGTVLDTVVMKVSAKHRASVYDPRRVVQGTLTAALTWGVFGLLSGGLKSLAGEPPIKPGTPDPYKPPGPGELRPEEQLQVGPITQYITSLVRSHDEPPEPHHGVGHTAG